MEEAQGLEGLLHVLLPRAHLHGFGRKAGRRVRRRTVVPSCSRKLSDQWRKRFPKDRFLLLTHFACKAASIMQKLLRVRPCYRALVSLPESYLIPRLALFLRPFLSPLPPTSYCSEQTITRLVWVLRPEINQNKCRRFRNVKPAESWNGAPPPSIGSSSLCSPFCLAHTCRSG